MTPQQLVGLGIRLFAIWLAIASLAYWVTIPSALAANNLGNNVISYAIGAAYVVAALLFWLFPMAIAHKLLPRTHYQNQNRLTAEPHELAKVGAALLGLWLITKAAPALVWLIFRSFLFTESGSAFSSIAPDAKLDLSIALFQLLLAVALIAKAGAFAQIVIPVAAAPAPVDEEPSEISR